MAVLALTLAAAASAETAADGRRSGFDYMSRETQSMQRDDSANPGMLWVRDGEAFKVFTASYNHWDFEKTDGRWAMSHRKARQMSPGKAV